MCTTGKYGDVSVMLESQGQFYIWERIGYEVYHIEHPTAKDAIIQAMRIDEVEELKLRKLERWAHID